MSAILLATLLAMPGVKIKNPAECMRFPADMQRTCSQEIRAGRPFEVPSEELRQEDSARSEQAPIKSHKDYSLEERRTIAAERAANATESISNILMINLLLSIGLIVTFLVVK